MLKDYYHLTKPGIIYGNAVTAVAGFLLAARGHFDARLFLCMLIGLSLVIASGCVWNNYLDRAIDATMDRTKNRAMVTGKISGRSAIIFGVLLLAGGMLALYCTNARALLVALFGFVVYVFAYTPLKRRTVHATIVGALAGAVPPVVGYSAVSNRFDAAAAALFIILIVWQLPHFYAIGIFRIQDYTQAGIPILPVRQGIARTKFYMTAYIIAFLAATSLLFFYKYSGYVYLAVMAALSLVWLGFAAEGFRKTVDSAKWAKKMFRFSLIVLLVFSAAISLHFHL